MIVGVTGYARHGKDTVGRRLVGRWGFRQAGFADALKSMALTLDPVIPQALDGDLEAPSIRLSELVQATGWDAAKNYAEVRRLLQVLGTECVRDHIGPDSWVQALERRWNTDGRPNLVITDVRFPNEAEWIHSNGGALFRVTRPGFDGGAPRDHPSERYVPELPADYEITNAATLDNLYYAVDESVRVALRGGGRW